MSPDKGLICRTVCFNQDKIARLKEGLPPSGLRQRTAEQYKAIGHPSRLSILLVLDEEECCVCDLSSILEQPVSTVSQHLRTLKSAGLVRSRQEGKLVFYSLERPGFASSFASAATEQMDRHSALMRTEY